MNNPEKPDLKLFSMMLILGLLFTLVGFAFLWLERASSNEIEARKQWVKGKADLLEVGIYYSGATKRSFYNMTARYTLLINEQYFEGSGVSSGNWSTSCDEVLRIIAKYAPEAKQLNVNDLSLLRPQHTWPVPSIPVDVLYNSADPNQSELILDEPIERKMIGNWFIYSFIGISELIGFLMLFFAWKTISGGRKNSPNIIGSSINKYPEADRQRLLNRLTILQTEIARLAFKVSSKNDSIHYLADDIDKMIELVKNGSFVPMQFAHQPMGRSIDEKFCNDKLTSLANDLQALIDELAKKTP